MTTAAELFEMVYDQLLPTPARPRPTSAEDRIRRPGDLPTQQDDYPLIKLRLIGETKQSQGRGSIGFLTTPVIRVTGEVSAPANLQEPKTTEVEARLWALKREIELAIVNAYPLFAHVQQLVSVQTQLSYTVEATHLAGVQSDFTFEIFESADDFAPLPVDDLQVIAASDPLHLPLAFRATLNP